MLRSSRLLDALLTGLVLVTCGTSPSWAQATTYSDEESFRAAAGSPLRTENFDGLSAGTRLTSQVSGVVFSSPHEGLEGYIPIQVFSTDGAQTTPHAIFGGDVGGSPTTHEDIVLTFSPRLTALGFYLCDYIPTATPAAIRIDFANEDSSTFLLGNDSNSELTPVFFGIVSDSAILRMEIIAGLEGDFPEEFTIDNLIYRQIVADRTPPLCSGRPATEGALAIDGSASDDGEGDSGLASVELTEDSSNLTLVVDPDFFPGAGSTTFSAFQTDRSADAHGTVVATDRAGNKCIVPVSFTFLAEGEVTNKLICSGVDFLFSVSGTSERDDYAACSASLPDFPDIARFPPGYEPTPAGDPFPCRLLTIESPMQHDTDVRMSLKKDGDFDERLRMLFAESGDGGASFPDFMDVTESVERIDTFPDPTRIGGVIQWTPVQVVCALQTETARQSYCDSLAPDDPGPDFDNDTFRLCAKSPDQFDCNDQRGFVHPGAPELCNGLDDNCDGARDEGNPGGGASCTVKGQHGACATGATRCFNGALVCDQTVTPVDEIACNGIDDDCDGSLDEIYNFSGYLPPIRPDGSVAFLKKRGAIPVKFQLTDCGGRFITNAVATIEVLFVRSGAAGDVVLDVSPVGNANTGNLFRFDPDSNQYIYNLAASSLAANSTYKIRTHLDDGTTHEVMISIK